MQYDLLSAQTNVSHILLKVTVCDTALQIQYSSTKEANEHVTQRDLKTFAQLNSKSDTFSCVRPSVVLMLRLTYSCILVASGIKTVQKYLYCQQKET